tara:strand:- start:2424 stop:3176 length:753 start_codon:yes stop_codon:yes gene_type:complete
MAANKKKEVAERKAARAAGKKIPRKCTYCGKTDGHQRRHCSLLKKDSKKLVKLAVEYRKDIRRNLETAGLGVGSLIQTSRTEKRYLSDLPEQEETTYHDYSMVTKLDIDEMLPWGNWYVGVRYNDTNPKHSQYRDVLHLTALSKNSNWQHHELFGTFQAALPISAVENDDIVPPHEEEGEEPIPGRHIIYEQRCWDFSSQYGGYNKVVHRTQPEFPPEWESVKHIKGLVENYLLRSTKLRENFRFVEEYC